VVPTEEVIPPPEETTPPQEEAVPEPPAPTVEEVIEESTQFEMEEDKEEPHTPEKSSETVEEKAPVEEPVQEPKQVEEPEKPSSLIPAVPFEISSSPIKSFFYSIFKPAKEEPNIEELLEQLTMMGFTDREANIEAIKFHNKFNEGLDAIVEDLITQSFLPESKKSENQN